MCIQNSICMVIIFWFFEDHILTFSGITPSSMLIFFLWIQEWKIYEFHVYILWPLLNLLLFLLPPPPSLSSLFCLFGAIAGGALSLFLALFSNVIPGKARRTTWRCFGSNPKMYNKYFSCLLSLQPYIHWFNIKYVEISSVFCNILTFIFSWELKQMQPKLDLENLEFYSIFHIHKKHARESRSRW